MDIQVQKLKLLKSNYLSEKYLLEDKIIKYYPQQIAAKKSLIEGLKSDVETAKQHPKPEDGSFVGIMVKGVFYLEKDKAGKAIIEACRSMTGPEAKPLGHYRGFDIELSFDTILKHYQVEFKGKTTNYAILGEDVLGNITRIDNVVEHNLESRLKTEINELENTYKQLENAKIQVEKPFAKEEELKTKTARLDELNILLNMDKKENEIVGGELNEDEEAPEGKQKDHVR